VTATSPGPTVAYAEREMAIAIDGGTITGWLSGDGPPLLLLHGGPGLSDYLAPLAAELAPSFSVFRYQQRGLPPSATSGERTVDAHVADAIRVLDGLGWDRAIVAGHSWGGHLAMHVAVAHPERTAALVAIDPLGGLGDGGLQEFRDRLLSQLSPDPRARFDEIEAHEAAGQLIEAEQLEGLGILWPYYFANPQTAPPMPPMRWDIDGSLRTWESINEHLKAGTLERGLPTVVAPTIFIHGASDPIPAAQIEQTAALVPDAALHVLEGIGHFPYLEQPGSVRKLLVDFAAKRVETNTG
jgi:proline iminopeptidase